MENVIEKIFELCNGTEYNRDVPSEAKELAKQHGYVIIVGGSDDLMYAYGADCYLTDYIEHGYGWDGNTLENISDKQLEKEAKQLGLKIWWYGRIVKENITLPNYNSDEMGGFSYTVKEGIEYKNFKVIRDDEVYCTGIIIKLPDGFVNSLDLT